MLIFWWHILVWSDLLLRPTYLSVTCAYLLSLLFAFSETFRSYFSLSLLTCNFISLAIYDNVLLLFNRPQDDNSRHSHANNNLHNLLLLYVEYCNLFLIILIGFHQYNQWYYARFRFLKLDSAFRKAKYCIKRKLYIIRDVPTMSRSSVRLTFFFRVRLVKLTRPSIRVFFYFKRLWVTLHIIPVVGKKYCGRYKMEIIVCYRVAL